MLVGMLFTAVAFVSVPTYLTYCEFVYLRYGKTVDAMVTQRGGVWRGGGRGSSFRPMLNVQYSFQDGAGHQQAGHDDLPSGSDVQKGQSIKVEYVHGSAGKSRVVGNKPDVTTAWLMFGSSSMIFLGFAWLVWKSPSIVKKRIEEPVSVAQLAKSLTMSKAEGIGWLIAGAVGAVLIGISLFGGFGESGWVVVVFVLGLLVALFAISASHRIARVRTHALRPLARKLGFQFAAEGQATFHQSLARFHLASLGPASVLTNLMYGKRDGTDVAVFDFEHYRQKQPTRQTVIWMQRRGSRMTEFALRPDSVWWNRLDSVGDAYRDIDFDSHPNFSRDYLLRGDDESAICELFTDDVLRFYEKHPGLITEGSGNKLLFYRDEVVVKPENIRSFLDEALTVRSLFQPTTER